MTAPINNIDAPRELGFCELITTCQLGQLAKRIVTAVIDIFVALGTGFYEAAAWIYRCITCQKTEEQQTSDFAQRVRDIAEGIELTENLKVTRDGLAVGTEERRVYDAAIERRELLDVPDRDEAPDGDERPFGGRILPVTPRAPEPILTVEQRIRNLLEGPDTTETLKQARDAKPLGSDERRIYDEAVTRREALDAATEPAPRPANEPAPRPANPIANRNDLQPAPGARVLPTQKPGVAIPLAVELFFKDGQPEANRAKAQEQMKEIRAAVDTALAGIKLEPEKSLKRLAEIETGTAAGTLNNPPPRVFERLAETPLRVKENLWSAKMVVNTDRNNIWPEGGRAADKLVALRKEQEQSLRRYAEIQVLQNLFQIDPQTVQFDIDTALSPYSTTFTSDKLKKWYDYASFADDEPSKPSKEDYEAMLRKYANPYDEPGKIVARLLSNNHDLLERVTNGIKVGSEEEKNIKQMVRTFITQLVDANKGCVDQMNSQLEVLTLDFLAYTQADKSPLEKMKFRAGLALCQYRAKLIQAFSNELYPNELHMADLEREAKKKLAENLGLNGSVFRAGAAYDVVSDVPQKAEKIQAAVFEKHNPSLFLFEETQASHNSVPATTFLHTDLIGQMNLYLGLNDLDSDNPFVIELSKDKRTEGDDIMRADVGGPLSFEATLLYLQAAGIFLRTK